MSRLIDAELLKAGFEEDGHLSPYIESFIDACPTLEEKMPGWISVKDRLPENNVRVLVCSNNGDKDSAIAITHYTQKKYGFNIEGWNEPWQYFFYNHDITHWMPLPEPPKEE